ARWVEAAITFADDRSCANGNRFMAELSDRDLSLLLDMLRASRDALHTGSVPKSSNKRGGVRGGVSSFGPSLSC
ncbi:hypothetical protein, partial [Thioalkalivibrio sp.]|uniref:hypothetical protein n=1 Tax=Thioalkalivibrio sp. TaxID=2093813 RepID=UPI00397722E0